MKLNEIMASLEKSEQFNEWRNANNDFYLCHVFFMTGHSYQVGFFNPENDMMVTFDVDNDKVAKSPESEVFKEADKVKELLLDNVDIDIDKAMEIAESVREKQYKGEIRNKHILILQNIKQGQLYNITFLTDSFKTLNIKIDAKTGKVLSHSISSLISLGTGNGSENKPENK